MSTQSYDPNLQELLRSLAREFFQTETSAVRHCRREAKRNEGTAIPLLHIVKHAEAQRGPFAELARKRQLPVSGLGMSVGAAFSQARDKLFDKLIRAERSYRGTMLGVRHGVDLVRLLLRAAGRADDAELREFCERWLADRELLVDQLAGGLDWFASNPGAAMQLARTPV